MSDGQERMVQEHPRAGVAHDLFDRDTGLRFVTVDRASAAGWLVLPIGAVSKSSAGVGDKVSACIAEAFLSVMVGMAVERHHGFHGSLLIVHTGSSGSHGLSVSQFFHDFPADIFLGQGIVLDGDIRVAQVEGQPFMKEIGKALVRSFGQSPGGIVPDPGIEGIHGGMEKDHGSVSPQMGHGRMAVGGAAAGGDNMVEAVDRQDGLFFHLSQGHMTVCIDYVLEASAFSALDENVGINKIAGGHFRQDDPDGALARTGHADQDNVGFVFFHGCLLYTGRVGHSGLILFAF